MSQDSGKCLQWSSPLHPQVAKDLYDLALRASKTEPTRLQRPPQKAPLRGGGVDPMGRLNLDIFRRHVPVSPPHA